MAIILETTVPDAYVTKVLTMLNHFTNREVTLTVDGQDFTSVDYTFAEKGGGETNIEYGQRFIKDFMLNCLKLVEENKARVAIHQAVDLIDIVADPVDDGSIT